MEVKSNRVSLVNQNIALREMFPDCEIRRFKEYSIIWTHKLLPSPLSASYVVQIRYVRKKGIKVYVLDPKPLQLAKGHSSLPHVYSHEHQELCLYHGNEWHPGMFYTQTIVPWIVEWLNHYEVWVATGNWHGGGITH